MPQKGPEGGNLMVRSDLKNASIGTSIWSGSQVKSWSSILIQTSGMIKYIRRVFG